MNATTKDNLAKWLEGVDGDYLSDGAKRKILQIHKSAIGDQIDRIADVIYRKQVRRDGWLLTREELVQTIGDALRQDDPNLMSEGKLNISWRP